jgi:DNA-binding winged helix-turn-helix (wHTH) protein
MAASTAHTPALAPSAKSPPRNNAPGRDETPAPPGPPKQLESPPGMPADVVQSVQLFARSAQSSTHSFTFPTMSNTPQLDLQVAREPVFTASKTFPVLQSDVPLSVPGSGVPAAARCHSPFLPDSTGRCSHARWNRGSIGVRRWLEDGFRMMEADRCLTFGDFSLDLAKEQLLCSGQMVALTPKAFAVLRRLVEDGGQVVSKEDLRRAGWAKTHVSDGVLKVIIFEIRRALGDDPVAPRFIETVPRRGYRFTAPRTRVPRLAAAADVRTALVGRDALLAQLDQRLERARAGQRQLVFLSGEAGIGKTAVLDTFLARAASDPDLLIARGTCLEHYGAAEAYLPVLEAFGRLLREPGAERAIRVLKTHAPTWLVQLPWLEDREALSRELFGVTTERMLREMAEALETLTATTPLLLVLEDLHWSDYSTLDLLGMLARRQEAARLLVIGSYRSVDVIVKAHPLRALVQELRVRRQCEDIPPGIPT